MSYLNDLKTLQAIEAQQKEVGLDTAPSDIQELEASKLPIDGSVAMTGSLSLKEEDITADYQAVHKKYVDDSISNSGGGDMLKTNYDPANIVEQVVGLTASQSVTNKTVNGVVLDSSGAGNKVLKDDGSYQTLAAGGDMTSSTYDPQNISGDAFNVDNHTDGATNKVFTSTDKTTISNLSTVATSGSYNDLSNKPTTITPTESANIVANTAKISYTDASVVAQNSDDISNLADVANSGDYSDLTNKPTTITTAQANAIVANTAKVSNVDHPLVETAVPSGAVFTDTVYDDSDVIKDSDVLTAVSGSNKIVTQSDVSNLGGGDMLASVYDTNGNNIVDNSEKLNNQDGSYYLDYNNATNKPTIPSPQDLDDTLVNGASSSQKMTLSGLDALSLSNPNAEMKFDDDDQRRITCNDGGGNWNFRSGNYYSSSDKYLNTGDGASHIRFMSDNVNGSITMRVAPIGSTNGTISWSDAIELTTTSFKYGGNDVLTDSDVATVATSGSYNDLSNKPTTITTSQANDIAANTSKISYTDAAAVALNTAKVGITSQQASDITANNAKVGITTAQANAITANTAKRSYPLADENRLANTSGTNTGDQDISGIATNASNISNLAFDVSANTSDISTNGSNISSNTSAIITNANNISSATQRANHTGTQLASTISDFDSASNAVIGGFSTVDDGYEVEEADNNSVLSYDDASDGNIVLNENSGNAVSIGFRCKVIQANDGLITFQTSGSSTIKSLNSAVETSGEGAMVDVIKISTNGWLISGDIQ